MQTLLGKHWHHLASDEVIDLLDADTDQGLDTFEVTRRQNHFGPNAVSPRKGRGPVLSFLMQFHQPLIYILLAAGVATACLQEWLDAGVILGVVLVNAIVGFLQEAKALDAIEALKRVLSSEATVVRAGEKRRIAASELVPGDIVHLQSGDRVPADLRLIHTREIQLDESSLTGESVPVSKVPDVLAHDTILSDRVNMAYSSTLVTSGTAAGVVIATGDKTEIGQISHLITSADELETPLTRKISRFSHVLLYVIIALSTITFAIGMFRGEDTVNMFMAAVALAVGAIPEGLPAAMTITLAIGVSRMARRHAIIRKLPAVETLGSTTVICSDKTGTLTQNEMTVQAVVAGNQVLRVSGIGYAPIGSFSRDRNQVDPRSNIALNDCLAAGALCNDSRLVEAEEGWKVEGDPTEGALLTSAQKAGLAAEVLQQSAQRIDVVPFESQHQYMATLHDAGPERPRFAYLKGSIERVLERCTAALDADGEEVDLDLNSIHQQAEALASQGLRVLAFARREFLTDTKELSHDDLRHGATFLGLQGMIDPPRKEAIEAVQACKLAGIRVVMITGDHEGTAVAIARQIGLVEANDNRSSPAVLLGAAIAEMSDRELSDVVEATSVFARVTPKQKLRIVQAMQTRGQVVAMTGDGVNDAPSLRQANIGVAMGIAGTDVSKEAADMVLTDDNFASIEAAVEEGRGVFENLVKFITWTLPTNLGEGLVILVAVMAGAVLPILPVQILWINMTTAVLLGLMLAFEPKEPGMMEQPPRDPQLPILPRYLVGRIVLVGLMLLTGSFGLFQWALANGASEAVARTVAVNVFVIGELFYLFNCRSLTQSMFALGVFSNRWLLGGVTCMAVLQLLFTYSPWMNRMFQSAPLGWNEWLAVIACGFAIYCVVGLEKMLRRRSRRDAKGLRASIKGAPSVSRVTIGNT